MIDNADLEAAKARVRALYPQCSGIILMSASDSARSARTYQRRKLRYRRAGMDLPEDMLVRAMLQSGWYVRPKFGEPTFEGAVRAAERMLLRFISRTLTCEVQNFQTVDRTPMVDANSHEATENEHADAKS
jgi:hypothetical protein